MELSDGSHSAMLRVFVGLDIPTESESRNQILVHVCIFIFCKDSNPLLFDIDRKSHWFIRMFNILEWSFTGVVGVCSLI